MKTIRYYAGLSLVACLLLTACQKKSKSDPATAPNSLETAIEDWQLTSILTCPIPLEIPDTLAEPIVVSFLDHKLEGFGGCNRISAQYQTKGEQLIIEQLLVTESYCAGISDLEYQFIQTLSFSQTYRINGDQLEILCGDMGGLVFHRITRPRKAFRTEKGQASSVLCSQMIQDDLLLQIRTGLQSANKYLLRYYRHQLAALYREYQNTMAGQIFPITLKPSLT